MPLFSTPSQRRFQRLITRLVLQDALRVLGWGVGLVVMVQAFLFKYVPPWDIRDGLQSGSASFRAGFVLAMLLLYCLLTRPLLHVLLGSKRLRYLLHFPLSPQQWDQIHLGHLTLLNLPWMGLSFYASLTGKGALPITTGLGWWLGWCLLTLVLQMVLYKWPLERKLLSVVALLSLYPLLKQPGFLGGWPGWGLLVVMVFPLRWLLRLPPPPGARRDRSFWPRVSHPVVVWLRLEWLTLWRRFRQALVIRLLWQNVFLLGLCLAVANNGLRDPVTLFHVAMGVMIPASLLMSSLAIKVHQAQEGFEWWNAHLGLTGLQLFGARWCLAFLTTLPLPFFTLVWLNAGLPEGASFPVRWVLLLLFGGWVVGAWSAFLVLFLGWRAQWGDVLQEGIFWGLMGHTVPLLVVLVLFPVLLLGLPLLCVYYARQSLRWLGKQRTLSQRVPPPRGTSFQHE